MGLKKIRLDLLCVEKGLAPSRQRAQALILAGQVLVDDEPVTKAGTSVAEVASLRLRGADHPFVSRGGLKLQAALDAFSLDISGKVALDVGASTGGFTDCLLQNGARHVIAVDVGYGQLAWKLRQDVRVTNIERCNARNLEVGTLREALGERDVWPLELATIDVSFISLQLVLPAVHRILGAERPIIALVKPQFEAGRADVGKGGVVRDPEKRQLALTKVLDWARQEGYEVKGELDSPVPGPKGNVERLVLLITPSIKNE